MPDSSSEIEPIVSDAPVAAAADPTPAPVVPAEPTPAEKPISILDAVTKALEPAEKPGVDAGTPTAENRSSKDATGTQDTPPDKAEPADISPEELARLSAKTQERVRWLAAQKSELTGKVEAATREVETYRPKAAEHDKLVGYLTRNGINSDEANNSLEVTRLIKAGDFTTALKVLTPIYQEVQKRAGEVLPPDLLEDVRLGNMPHERALEISRGRASQAATTERDQREAERQRVDGEQNAWSTHVTTVAKAADTWAKSKSGSDPDWDKKQTEVAEIVELDLRRNGFPKTAAEAVQRSEKALEEVNTRWKRLRGNLTEIKPTVGGSRVSTRTDAPKTALEAINRALDG